METERLSRVQRSSLAEGDARSALGLDGERGSGMARCAIAAIRRAALRRASPLDRRSAAEKTLP
jgi:hypothetical protein